MKKVSIGFIILIIIIIIISFVDRCSVSNANDVLPSASMTAEAAETAENEFHFERIDIVDNSGITFKCLRETSTDVIYLIATSEGGPGVTAMLDPETGLPLTYTNWKAKYQN